MAEQPYDGLRDEFLDADRRFRESLSSAFAAHAQCVAMFGVTLTQIGRRETELQESITQLQSLVLEQGQALRALRERLDGGEQG